MVTRPLVFHCGLPKTGSTYLQKHVFPFAEGATVSRGESLEEMVILLSQDTDMPLIVSNENLSVRPSFGAVDGKDYKRKRVRQLRVIAETWPDSRLLLFVREPAAFLKSLYLQYVFSGGVLTFEGWRAKHRLEDALGFDEFIDEILAMPWESVLILDHDQLLHDRAKTISRIARFVECQLSTPSGSGKAHVSVDRAGARVLLCMNRLYDAMARRWAHRHYLLRLAKRLLVVFSRLLIQEGPLRFLSRVGHSVVNDRVLEEIRLQWDPSWQSALRKIAAAQERD